jgi:hypothetical protein
MARQEEEREDLLAEATALVERIEFLLPGYPQPAVAGFRSNGCVSLFFGADPVYQFNTLGQLRRAYVDGLLYRADRGRLASISRSRLSDRVQMTRSDLDVETQSRFLGEMRAHLDVLRGALESEQCEILGQVPANGEVLARLCGWLAALAGKVEIAASPHSR